MKVTPSPLVSEMRGKTAGLVAATWKGIQYVRMHVIPQNPRTAAQTLVREALARCVTLWRSLHVDVKTWLDSYYGDYAMSGFNGFIRLCRTLEQADEDLKPVPDNPYHGAVDTFAAATGAGASGDIDCTWVKEAADALTYVALFCREKNTNVFTTRQVQSDVSEASVISGLTAGADHDVYAAYTDTTTKEHGTVTVIADVASKA